MVRKIHPDSDIKQKEDSVPCLFSVRVQQHLTGSPQGCLIFYAELSSRNRRQATWGHLKCSSSHTSFKKEKEVKLILIYLI